MKSKGSNTKSKPSPRGKRCLPPGSSTPAPSWWPADILGPFPGPFTEDTVWRLCREAVLDEYYRNQA